MLLEIYQRLPYALRVAAATLHGSRLKRARYGPESEGLVRDALARDAWDSPRWRRFREEELPPLLHHAATRVPYYRAQWAERRARGDRRPWDVLESWPLLRKDDVRAQPRAFLADGAPGRLQELHTSGSTGKPLTLWRGGGTQRRWYALCDARLFRWNGVSSRDRGAVLGGQLVARAAAAAPPFWVFDHALRQLYMSSYHLTPGNAPHYVRAMREHQVRYVESYPSSLHALAVEILAQGLTPPALRVAVTNAEPLFPHQRQAIERAFGCPVRNTYGMAEIVAGASECEQGSLHLWPEAGIVEVLPEPGASSGAFVCTGLLNREMPLIRYEVGDRGTLAPEGEPCACGRGLPVLREVEGRLDDVLRTADGRRIGRLDPVFKGDFAIREAQIVQETLSRIRVLLVPDARFDARQEQALVARLRERVGELEVVVERVSSIPRSANGKLRGVISLVAAGDPAP